MTAFAIDGAELFENAIGLQLSGLRAALAELPAGHAGLRLNGVTALDPFLAETGPVGQIAAELIGPQVRPVRAILFDKTPETNWVLAWHQDRTICVTERQDVEGFGPWTVKHGMQHVAPPFGLLARMATLRIHLDDVPMTNAPLLIAPGSHKAGRVPVEEIDNVVRRCGTFACVANAGDIWAYATPILHASEAASVPGHRRVLQVDYSVDKLPGGLCWLGV